MELRGIEGWLCFCWGIIIFNLVGWVGPDDDCIAELNVPQRDICMYYKDHSS
jgi:hypothetical protein